MSPSVQPRRVPQPSNAPLMKGLSAASQITLPRGEGGGAEPGVPKRRRRAARLREKIGRVGNSVPLQHVPLPKRRLLANKGRGVTHGASPHKQGCYARQVSSPPPPRAATGRSTRARRSAQGGEDSGKAGPAVGTEGTAGEGRAAAGRAARSQEPADEDAPPGLNYTRAPLGRRRGPAAPSTASSCPAASTSACRTHPPPQNSN